VWEDKALLESNLSAHTMAGQYLGRLHQTRRSSPQSPKTGIGLPQSDKLTGKKSRAERIRIDAAKLPIISLDIFDNLGGGSILDAW
jgi:hypothetical protein